MKMVIRKSSLTPPDPEPVKSAEDEQPRATRKVVFGSRSARATAPVPDKGQAARSSSPQASARKLSVHDGPTRGGDPLKLWIGFGIAAAILLLIVIVAAASGRSGNRRQQVARVETAPAVEQPSAKKELVPLDELGGMTMQEWCKKKGDSQAAKERKKRVAQYESGRSDVAGRATK